MVMLAASEMIDTGNLLAILGIAIALSAYLSAIRLMAIQKIGDLSLDDAQVEAEARTLARTVYDGADEQNEDLKDKEVLVNSIHSAVQELTGLSALRVAISGCLEDRSIQEKLRNKLHVSNAKQRKKLSWKLSRSIEKAIRSVDPGQKPNAIAYEAAYEITRVHQDLKIKTQKENVHLKLGLLTLADIPIVFSAILLGLDLLWEKLKIGGFLTWWRCEETQHQNSSWFMTQLKVVGKIPDVLEQNQGFMLEIGLWFFLAGGLVMFLLHFQAWMKTAWACSKIILRRFFRYFLGIYPATLPDYPPQHTTGTATGGT